MRTSDWLAKRITALNAASQSLCQFPSFISKKLLKFVYIQVNCLLKISRSDKSVLSHYCIFVKKIRGGETTVHNIFLEIEIG